MRRIPMFWPFMPPTAGERVAETLKTRWVGQGPKVDQFEEELKKKFGWKHVLALNSGTSAIRLALAVAGVGPGDEVITPALTCVATNTPILEQYATPVFADIEYETLNLNPEDIAHRITEKTRAVICVDWAGYPCDFDEIRMEAREYAPDKTAFAQLPIIEDAAHALGATYKGKAIGNVSDFTCFSLQAIKQITTGEGGILTCLREEDYKSARRRRWFGIPRFERKPTVLGHDPTYDITEVGYKYNLNDILATIGLEQLKYFNMVQKRRAEIAEWYREELEGVKGVTLLEEKSDRVSGNWLFTMHVDRRLKFAEMMWAKGVEVSVAHWRNDRYTVFGGLGKDLPNTERADKTMINIPLHMSLSDDDVHYIINCIKGGW